MTNFIDKAADYSAKAVASIPSIIIHTCFAVFATWYLIHTNKGSDLFGLLIVWVVSIEATMQNILQQRSINTTHASVKEVHKHVKKIKK